MLKFKVLIVVGTRPDTIKMAPLFKEFKNNSKFETYLCGSGQHLELLNQALEIFDLVPDFNLSVMTENQSLAGLSSVLIEKFSQLYSDLRPDLVIVHGDTTTAFIGALAAFYQSIPIAHIEAGLRTQDIHDPFPEEFNRQAIARMSNWNFVPTSTAFNNLLAEGIRQKSIFLSGNTIIDSVNIIKNKLDSNLGFEKKLSDQACELLGFIPDDAKYILVTMHRRESFGDGVESVCEALKEIATRNEGLSIVFPVHLNPKVQRDVFKILSGHRNIVLTKPISYDMFIYLMIKSLFIITDSGGIQEEAITLSKKVLVTRRKTERIEGVDNGFLKVISTNQKDIVSSVNEILNSKFQSEITSANPFGSGNVSKKIVETIESQIKFGN